MQYWCSFQSIWSLSIKIETHRCHWKLCTNWYQMIKEWLASFAYFLFWGLLGVFLYSISIRHFPFFPTYSLQWTDHRFVFSQYFDKVVQAFIFNFRDFSYFYIITLWIWNIRKIDTNIQHEFPIKFWGSY
jgi:hypothetical protein